MRMRRRGTEKCTDNGRCISESIYRRFRGDCRYPGILLFDSLTFSRESHATRLHPRYRDLVYRPRTFNIRLLHMKIPSFHSKSELRSSISLIYRLSSFVVQPSPRPLDEIGVK